MTMTNEAATHQPDKPPKEWPWTYFSPRDKITEDYVKELLLATGKMLPGENNIDLIKEEMAVLVADKGNTTAWLLERIKTYLVSLANLKGLTLRNNRILSHNEMTEAFMDGGADTKTLQEITLKMLLHLRQRGGSDWSRFGSELEAKFMKEHNITYKKKEKGASCILKTINNLKNDQCDKIRDATLKRNPGWKILFRRTDAKMPPKTTLDECVEWKKGSNPSDIEPSTQQSAAPATGKVISFEDFQDYQDFLEMRRKRKCEEDKPSEDSSTDSSSLHCSPFERTPPEEAQEGEQVWCTRDRH
jgi:hypothetical protein